MLGHNGAPTWCLTLRCFLLNLRPTDRGCAGSVKEGGKARKGNSRREIKDLFTVPDDHMSRTLLPERHGTLRWFLSFDWNYFSTFQPVYDMIFRSSLGNSSSSSSRDVRISILSMMITWKVLEHLSSILFISLCLKRRSLIRLDILYD